MVHPIKAYREAHREPSGKPMPLEKFGAMVDVEKNAVSRWEKGGKPSPKNCLEIEKQTDGEIPRWQLRPDLWPAPKLEAAQ